MKKNKSMAYSALVIAFLLFNVIAFAIPTEKTASFWVAYVFSTIAFASQIVIWEFAFKGTDTLKSKFFGIPIVFIGIIYLIIQIIAFAIFMAVPLAQSWIAVVVCALILGFSAICLIGTETAREEINRVDAKIEKKVFYIKSLQIDVEMLAKAETDADTKEVLTKLAEKIRFSDPMSSEMLGSIENRILDKLNELKTSDNKAKIVCELSLLLEERNMICKKSK